MQEFTRLDGRVAIVTGRACGTGACTATLLAHGGARVVIADIGIGQAEAVAQDVPE